MHALAFVVIFAVVAVYVNSWRIQSPWQPPNSTAPIVNAPPPQELTLTREWSSEVQLSSGGAIKFDLEPEDADGRYDIRMDDGRVLYTNVWYQCGLKTVPVENCIQWRVSDACPKDTLRFCYTITGQE